MKILYTNAIKKFFDDSFKTLSMPFMIADTNTQEEAHKIYKKRLEKISTRTDSLFAWLLIVQWIFGVLCAIIISPETWNGSESTVHPHVWASVFLGGLIIAYPVYSAFYLQGATLTRHIVAISQMLISALLVHLTGGRIETHFHVFGSLAFLSFYRDWKVLATATLVTTADHFLRGYFFPMSVFGVITTSQWRWLEHAGWVLFEDFFLIRACVQSRTDLIESCFKEANDFRRIAELKQTRVELIKSKNEAVKMSELKSQFLANMSHEIRTPLNGIIGIIDVLKKSNLPEEVKYNLDTVANSGDLLLTIINDILELSKIEAGKLVLENRTFNLHECIQSLADSVAGQAFKKNLEFIVDIHPDVPTHVTGDETRIKQVLLNLVGNAIKFTPDGSIKIQISSKDQTRIIIEVIDTGVGIPQSKMLEIFSTFAQVDNSDTRKYGGTGLGLSISKSIVEAMNGKIFLQSEEAKGTTFTVDIPLKADSDVPVANSVKEKLKQEEILVVTASMVLKEHLIKQFKNLDIQASSISDMNQNLLEKIKSSLTSSTVMLLDSRIVRFMGEPHFSELVEYCANKQKYFILLLESPLTEDLKSVLKKAPHNSIRKPVSIANLLDLLVTKRTANYQQIAVSSTEKEGSKSRGKVSILVVEDTPANQRVATLMLTAAGYSFKIAENGLKGLELYKNEHFDLILMDCQMPIMDGYEATRKIREYEKSLGRRAPIIAMTANAYRETKERCFESGMDSFVTKPIKLNDLTQAIEEVRLRQSA